MGQYVLKKTLVKHGDSVNTLVFSYDGSLFASGADDGLVIIFRGNGSGQELRRFQVKAPVTALLWRSRFGYTIIAGDASGDVHTICVSDSTHENAYYHTVNNVSGLVHCIAQSHTLLAISSGNVVQLIKQGTIATWDTVARLPDPPKFPELEGELPEPMARSLHFLGTNDHILLATYLDHGVIAWDSKTLEIKWRIRPRSLSPNGRFLAVTNLYDGIDWYSLDSNHFMDAPFLHTTTHAISENVILPVTFIHGGTAVLSGTSTGCARITNLKDYSLAESLQHDPNDILQAVAYSGSGDLRQIITGVSERGSETRMKYWIQPRSPKKQAQPKSKPVIEKIGDRLTMHRMTLGIIVVACSLAFVFRDVRGNSGAQDRFGNILSVSPFLGSRREQSLEQSETLNVDMDDGSSGHQWPDEPASQKLRGIEMPEYPI
ncbi:WD40-repeat-containing domain protein [Lactarius indigo]|nr:WD40-repeat-containing domain protein [Lactarius indigo]